MDGIKCNYGLQFKPRQIRGYPKGNCGLPFSHTHKWVRQVTVSFNGVTIKLNGEQLISLTDLWKASGKSLDYKPYDWARKEGSEFIKAASQKLNKSTSLILETYRGRTGGTYAVSKSLNVRLKYIINL